MLKFFCSVCRTFANQAETVVNSIRCRNCGAFTQTLVPNPEKAEAKQERGTLDKQVGAVQ